MKSLEEVESDIISLINDKQEMAYAEIKKYAETYGIEDGLLERSLKELEKANAIASRNSGGVLTYYMLQEEQPIKRVFIVEDDRNINKLMALSIGKEFEITQIYDGKEAMERIKYEKPDLVILDLMLPGMDGLEICQRIKSDESLKDTVVIIVSAMDATSNRFKGIKYGADYYIKKPFDPAELRSLVTIFLKKKGRRFDPLIDLPNEERITNAVENAMKQGSLQSTIGTLKVEGLAEFANAFGTEAGMTILRLVSQLLQDKVKEIGNVFVGFLNSSDFVIAGDEAGVRKLVEGIKAEFSAVLPFVYQSEGYKPIELGVENAYSSPVPSLSLSFTAIGKQEIAERRAEVLKNKPVDSIGAYTYEELRHILGSEDIDVTITRDPSGVKLSVSKRNSKEKPEKDKDLKAI
ncbi:MAG: response regulator transcription factor [Candidatus Micrarchaeia archaeon]